MNEVREQKPIQKRKHPVRELIETFLVALAIAMLIRTFGIEVYRVSGSSMLNTLHHGERVLVNKFLYHFREPHPGEIIIFQYPRDPSRDFIKRVVAVAGDRVTIKNGKVYVNDQLMPEAETVRTSIADVPEQRVPEDSVWVLGDNRNNSEDSRFFGEVPLDNIQGMAFVRVWPLQVVSGFENPVAKGKR